LAFTDQSKSQRLDIQFRRTIALSVTPDPSEHGLNCERKEVGPLTPGTA
jgi:hypothetical protein